MCSYVKASGLSEVTSRMQMAAGPVMFCMALIWRIRSQQVACQEDIGQLRKTQARNGGSREMKTHIELGNRVFESLSVVLGIV